MFTSVVSDVIVMRNMCIYTIQIINTHSNPPKSTVVKDGKERRRYSKCLWKPTGDLIK